MDQLSHCLCAIEQITGSGLRAVARYHFSIERDQWIIQSV